MSLLARVTCTSYIHTQLNHNEALHNTRRYCRPENLFRCCSTQVESKSRRTESQCDSHGNRGITATDLKSVSACRAQIASATQLDRAEAKALVTQKKKAAEELSQEHAGRKLAESRAAELQQSVAATQAEVCIQVRVSMRISLIVWLWWCVVVEWTSAVRSLIVMTDSSAQKDTLLLKTYYVYMHTR